MIAIGICEKVNGICNTTGCFRAFNNKTGYFELYKEESIKLNSFFTCQACSSDSMKWLNELAVQLKSKEIEIIHLGKCIAQCEAGQLEVIKNCFEIQNIKVVVGTHD